MMYDWKVREDDKLIKFSELYCDHCKKIVIGRKECYERTSPKSGRKFNRYRNKYLQKYSVKLSSDKVDKVCKDCYYIALGKIKEAVKNDLSKCKSKLQNLLNNLTEKISKNYIKINGETYTNIIGITEWYDCILIHKYEGEYIRIPKESIYESNVKPHVWGKSKNGGLKTDYKLSDFYPDVFKEKELLEYRIKKLGESDVKLEN